MDAKRELEKVIVEYLDTYFGVPSSALSEEIKEAVDAILSKLPELGYVRLEDVEICKGKLEEVLANALYQEHIKTAYWTVETIAKTIASAKPIRVKK